MEYFDAIYKEAIKYSKKVVSNYKKIPFNAEELVSEAYLSCSENPTFENLKIAILELAKNNRFLYLREIRSQYLERGLMEKQCIKCREIKPIAFFKQKYDERTLVYVTKTVCKDCIKIQDKNYYYKNKPRVIQRIVEYNKGYRKRTKYKSYARNKYLSLPSKKSKYKGVSWQRSIQKWRVKLYRNKKNKTLGYFKNDKIAHVFYLEQKGKGFHNEGSF